MQNSLSILHARSLAEDVLFKKEETLYSGNIDVSDGKIVKGSKYTLSGRSLLHSAPLTVEAFKRSFMGNIGQYIVTFGSTTLCF